MLQHFLGSYYFYKQNNLRVKQNISKKKNARNKIENTLFNFEKDCSQVTFVIDNVNIIIL